MTTLPFRITPPLNPPVNFSVIEPKTRPLSVWDFVREAWRRQRSRTRLADLNDHMLKDIGLSRSEAWREYSKPFWRP